MQPIHRTSCQDIQPLSATCRADYLAALIDGQAQARRALADDRVQGTDSTEPPGGNALIWVEGEPKLADRRDRGMIVVGHGSDPAAAERSSVISYPLEASNQQQCIPAVTSALQGMGWSVVALRCRKTAAGRANTAVLVNQTRPGGEQRLLLAEPIQAAQQRPAAPMPIRRNYLTRRSAAVVRPGRLTGKVTLPGTGVTMSRRRRTRMVLGTA